MARALSSSKATRRAQNRWSCPLATDDDSTAAAAAGPTKFPGWVGPFQGSAGSVWGGENVQNGSSLWAAFRFGTAVIENSVADEGFSLQESVEFECGAASANSVWGLLLPGVSVLNNPNDTSLWAPTKWSPAEGRFQGLVQAASRWSQLATLCPQIAGVQLDDFLRQYVGNVSKPGGPCVTCPASKPQVYGDMVSGQFCCSQKPHPGVCNTRRNDTCCLVAGISKGPTTIYNLTGCEGIITCGNNPHNHRSCYPEHYLTLDDMIDIKAALLGKTLHSNGTVDHTSVARTPHLRMVAVWYNSETIEHSWLKEDGLFEVLDGASLWISDQTVAAAQNYSEDVAALAQLVPPTFRLFVADYIRYSDDVGYEDPQSFYSIMNQTLHLYDDGKIEGSFWHAGEWFTAQHMNQSYWDRLDLPHWMDSTYYPYLGAVDGRGTNAKGEPVAGAVMVATYGDTHQFVTRRKTSTNGTFNFSGWAGLKAPTPHTVKVSASGYKLWSGTVQIKGQARTDLRVVVALL